MDRSSTQDSAKAEAFGWSDDPLWYKDAIVYQLHVKAFYDSNGDGIGDLAGLTQKLDYIQDLGVNAVWLLPFYPSPLKDDGYDIADYRGIHAAYGTLADFQQFVREAHRRGLKVITELVINHTSDQHPWFQAARRAPPGSSKRNYYVWSDSDKKWPETRIIFTDTENSNWCWDPLAQAYYWHRFFSHQPDLNFDHPSVIKAVMRTMRYWLDIGVDGMRLDAIPYLCERDGTNNENLPETHAVLKYMRAELDKHYRNRFFLAEANQWPEDVREYFGDGDECHVAYHFPLMPRIYMAVAQEERHPITDIMLQTPDIPASCQWAIFLRNHDELTLEMVTERERDYMYQMYADDPRARLNVGIRRRLAPLMENNRHKIELLTSLLLSLPGSPILYYGDEIGMGDNIFLGDRNGVRTPMQWSPDRNAGFSRADPQRLYLPPIMDPVFGYLSVNVEAQSRSSGSLLNWTRRLIAARQAHKAFGRGTLKFLHPGNRKILAYLREYEGESILCVANLSRTAQPVELDLAAYKARVPLELLGRTAFPAIGEPPYFLTLPGHGFYWFRLAADVEAPVWHVDKLPPAELPVLVLPEGWLTLLAAKPQGTVRHLLEVRSRVQLEQQILPRFLAARRWFSGKGQTIERIELAEAEEWQPADGMSWLLCFVNVTFADSVPQAYFLPLGLALGDKADQQYHALAPWMLARARQHARLGVLYDALGEEAFCRALLAAIGANRRVPRRAGELVFSRTSAFPELSAALQLEVEWPGLEQSNTSIIFGDELILKIYRRLQPGINPELEMGRFLTEASPFSNIAPLAGALEYRGKAGELTAIAVLQAYVPNQGTGWDYTVDYLDRLFDAQLARRPEEAAAESGWYGDYLALMATLGRRTGELHVALAKSVNDPAFAPEPVTQSEWRAWVDRVAEEATLTLDQLQRRRSQLDRTGDEGIERVLNARGALLDRINTLTLLEPHFDKTRLHGDYHLGQVLLAENDWIVIDFEGEPARPVAERRAKHSPLRDVAGMLRSFSYAAAAGLRRFAANRLEDAVALEPLARAWERDARSEFMRGYRAGAAGCSSVPVDETDQAAMIELFTLEKALYEMRYELDNRPDWLAIPLAGVLEMLALASETCD